MRWLWLVIAILVLGAVLVGTDALPGLVDVVARGRRLSVDREAANGVVSSSVAELVAQAAATVGRPVSEKAYSLARVCRSEEGRAGQITKVMVCHVVCNQADALGWDVTSLVQLHKNAARDEHYGAQISGRVASGEDPFENDLAAAEYALAQRDRGVDPTNGACNFVDRRAFGVQEGTGSFAELLYSWAGEGKRPGTLPEAPPSLVFFWKGAIPIAASPVVV